MFKTLSHPTPFNSLNSQPYCFPPGNQSEDFWAEEISFGNIINYELFMPTIQEGIAIPLTDYGSEMTLALTVQSSAELHVGVFIDLNEDFQFSAEELQFSGLYSSGAIDATVYLSAEVIDQLNEGSKTWRIIVSEEDYFQEGIDCEWPEAGQKSIDFMSSSNPPKLKVSTTSASGQEKYHNCLDRKDPLSLFIQNISNDDVVIYEIMLSASDECSRSGNFQYSACNGLFAPNLPFINNLPYCYEVLITQSKEEYFEKEAPHKFYGQNIYTYIEVSFSYNNQDFTERHILEGYEFCKPNRACKTRKSSLTASSQKSVTSQINSLYPNPTSQNTILDFELAEEGKTDIGIYNMYGQLVVPIIENQWLPPAHYELELPMSDLQHGSYYVVWRYKEQKEVKKIVKIR